MADRVQPMPHSEADAMASLENRRHMSTGESKNATADFYQEISPIVEEFHPEKLESHKQSNVLPTAVANDDFVTPLEKPRPWKLIWMRWGPLCGLFCMLAALSSVVASLAILLASDNSPTEAWQFEPSAYMALFTAIANQALRVAIVHGVVISWWTKALRGTTLKELHYDYEWLNGIPSWMSLRAGYRISLVGIACIASAVVAIDGPLLQKASTVVSAPIGNQPLSLNVSISPQIPHGIYGGWGAGFDSLFGSHIPTTDGPIVNNVSVAENLPLSAIESAYTTDGVISGFVRGCSTTCRVKVRAPAVAISSTVSHVVDVHYYQHSSSLIQMERFTPDRSTFVAYLGLLLNHPQEKMNLLTGYATTRNCSGNFNYTISTLESAIGEYDVLVTNGSVDPSTIGLPKIVALSNNTHFIKGQNSSSHSTLAGIVSFAKEKLECGITLGLFNGQPAKSSLGNTAFPAGFIASTDQLSCTSYRDPAPTILQDVNALMFRIGVLAAQTLTPTQLAQALDPGLDVNTTVIGQVEGVHNVFKSDLRWFMAAALVEIICISLIFPTYLGWWRIGRPISFSPLEIAKAFEAPLLSECDSNATGNDIARALGDVRVKYGAVDAAPDAINRNPKAKLAFASPEKVGQMSSYSRSKL